MKLQIWYMKPEWFRAGICGEEPNAKNLNATHIHLKDLDVTDNVDVYGKLEKAWVTMQGENWSPDGEARPLIEAKGLQHTSMSVGDVAVNEATGATYLCAGMGFVRIDGKFAKAK